MEADELLTYEDIGRLWGYSARYVRDKIMKDPDAPKPVMNSRYKAADLARFLDIKQAKSKSRRYTEAEWIEIEASGRHSSAIVIANRKGKIPAWADMGKIREIYKQAVIAGKKTRIPHDVDHEIPLSGDLVSGLHVHENLRVVTAKLNRSKGRKYTP